jgi:Tfp pilus assembly pilus retraction ATPase PilT
MVRAMLSESLRAVISQTLLKTKDGSGRVAAHEIMIGTPAIRNLIRENKIAQMYSAIQTGQQLRHADARPEPAGPGAAQRRVRGRSAHARRPTRTVPVTGLSAAPFAKDKEESHGTRSGIKFMHDLLRAMVAKKASDLFITAGFPPAIKIDGKMTPVSNQSLTPQHTQELARAS